MVDEAVGSLYRLRPGTGFAPLAPGQSTTLHIVHPDDGVNFSKAPQRPYLVFDAEPDAGHAIADYVVDQRTELSGAMTAGQIYERNARIVPVPLAALPPVLPTPRRFERRAGSLRWTRLPRLDAAPALGAEVATTRAMLSPFFASPPSASSAVEPPLRLEIAALAGQSSPEAYELNIDAQQGVRLTAASAAGMARALASLRQLLPMPQQSQGGLELPALYLSDAPRFAYRGLMLDVARNFQPKAEVLKLLELMARYKLNVFHFHLTDDEGWRLEIAGLPELTEVGARRGHSSTQLDRLPPAYGSGADVADAYGSGYYRRADYLEILKFAAARHIEVIPEIEMPGHARAAVRSSR